MFRIITLLLMVTVLLPITPALAQVETVPIPATDGAELLSVEEVIDQVDTDSRTTSASFCEPYNPLTGPSTSVAIQLEVEELVPGMVSTFAGTIFNDKSYPIVGGTLSAQIYRQTEAEQVNQRSDLLIDQFVVARDVFIGANEELPITFDWQVPNYVPAGEYYVAYSLRAHDAFEVLEQRAASGGAGQGSRTDFLIASQFSIDEALFFNANAITINGNQYISSDTTAVVVSSSTVIETAISNPTSEIINIPVQWQQYASASLDEAALRNTSTTLVSLAPDETQTISYTVAEQSEPTVMVVAQTEYQGVKSIINLSLQQSSTETITIDTAGLVAQPTSEGEVVTLFGCLKTSDGSNPDNTLVTATVLQDGEFLTEYVYGQFRNGELTINELFTLQEEYTTVTLVLTVTRDNLLLLEKQMELSCKDTGSALCPQVEEGTISSEGAVKSLLDKIVTNPTVFFGGLLVLCGILLLILLIHRRDREKNIPTTPKGEELIGPFSALLLLATASVFLVTGQPTLAATQSVNSSTQFQINGTGPGLSWGNEGGQGLFTATLDASQSTINSGDSVTFTVTIVTPYSGCPAAPQQVSLGALQSTFGNPFAPWSVTLSDNNGFTQNLVVPRVSSSCAGSGSRTFSTNVTITPSTTSNWTLRAAIQNGVWVGGDYAYPPWDFYTPLMLTVSTPVTVNSNSAPNPPTITGPTSGFIGQPYSFGFQSSDADGDAIRYQIDWDSNGSINQVLPSSGFVSSNTSVTATRFWSSEGSVTFRARAIDDNGGVSAWRSHTIAIAPPPAITCDIKINNSDGPISIGKNTTMTITWTGTNAPSYSLWGGIYNGPVAANGTLVTAARADTYILTCGDQTDSVVVTTTNSAPTAPVIDGPTTGVNNTPYTFGFVATDADNDPLLYEIDWDNNGTPDVAAPVFGRVAAGTRVTSNYSWLTDGVKVFRARSVDTDNVRSAWVNYTVTISTPPPDNQPPAAPTITGPTSGFINQSYTYSIRAFDPNADEVRYGFDWNNDGVVDQWLPNSTGYLPNNTLATANRLWVTAGNYTFQALAEDQLGAQSLWSQYSVSISNPPVNGSCGTVQDSCLAGTFQDGTDTATDHIWSCVGSNGGSTASCSIEKLSACSTGFVTSFRQTNTSPHPVACQSVDEGGDVDLPVCATSYSTLGETVTNATDMANGSCMIGPTLRGGIQCSYQTVEMGCASPVGPNLTAEDLSYSWYGEVLLQVGESIRVEGVVRNNGTASTGGPFTNVFEYRIGDSGSFIPFVSAPSDALNPGAMRERRQNFRIPEEAINQNLWIQFCVDSNNDISEIDESIEDNCRQINVGIIEIPPTIDVYESRINNGTWSSATYIFANLGETIRLRWDTSNVTNCVSDEFETSGSASNMTGVQIIPPPPGESLRYYLRCNGPGGTVSGFRQVQTRQRPNFNRPLITYAPSANYNPATGVYSSLAIIAQTTNDGGTAVPQGLGNQARYEIELDTYPLNTGIPPVYDRELTGRLGRFNVSQTKSWTRSFNNVPFGPTRIQVIIDPTNLVEESDETDNDRVLEFILPPPNPGLSITADQTLVREGERVNLSWDTMATYPMNCSVEGIGLNPPFQFDTSVSGRTFGSPFLSPPITAKTEYTLRCVEPLTGTTFTDSVGIQIVGTVEEF